jgi:hypothetical protein
MNSSKVRWASGAVIAVAIAGGVVVAPTAAQAAINYFDTTSIKTSSGSVSCPSGTKITGGGFKLPNNSYYSQSSTEYQITGSYPSGNSWQATATRVTGSYSSTKGWTFNTRDYSPSVYAICVK